MTPYYSDEWVTIYHGDCREILPTLAGQSVDLAITSPPYNMGLTPGGNGRGMYAHKTQKSNRFHGGYDGGHDDAMEWADYDRWQRWTIKQLLRVAKLGVFYNNRSRVVHGRLRLPLDGRYAGLPLRQMIVWDRNTGIDVNLRHYCTAHELILLFAHDEFKLVDHSASGMSDVWRLGMDHAADTGDHPATFPLSLPTRVIVSVDGVGKVLDPFMGSGTVLRAAKDLGRKAIGIEMSERYCEIAARRMGQEVLAL